MAKKYILGVNVWIYTLKRQNVCFKIEVIKWKKGNWFMLSEIKFVLSTIACQLTWKLIG